MAGVPYCVAPDTSVAEAVRHMAVRKLGSALVVEHGARDRRVHERRRTRVAGGLAGVNAPRTERPRP